MIAMQLWRDDDELFALMRKQLFPAVVGDILDTIDRKSVV